MVGKRNSGRDGGRRQRGWRRQSLAAREAWGPAYPHGSVQGSSRVPRHTEQSSSPSAIARRPLECLLSSCADLRQSLELNGAGAPSGPEMAAAAPCLRWPSSATSALPSHHTAPRHVRLPAPILVCQFHGRRLCSTPDPSMCRSTGGPVGLHCLLPLTPSGSSTLHCCSPRGSGQPWRCSSVRQVAGSGASTLSGADPLPPAGRFSSSCLQCSKSGGPLPLPRPLPLSCCRSASAAAWAGDRSAP